SGSRQAASERNDFRSQNAPVTITSAGPSPRRSYAIVVPSADWTVSTGDSLCSAGTDDRGRTPAADGTHRRTPHGVTRRAHKSSDLDDAAGCRAAHARGAWPE